ncbi:venom dipeptidyl peptidase 4 [Orussus abietinus]|uniref:venom dipeptidyl peptidase 4 n=1 Tax=Orussus abietinus TaxID=222816 RepID=UPI000C716323|nr:venom dipeptidyl peptidase 4 [Orussus abietinus]
MATGIEIADSNQELMTKTKRANWRRLLVGGVVGVLVLALVITAVILFTGPEAEGSNGQSAAQITLEEWLLGSLSTKSFNGTWISDDEILYRDESGNLLVFNVVLGSNRTILEITNNALASSFEHQLSPDRKYLLLASNYQKLYRHTYLAQYKIVNLETQEVLSLIPNDTITLQLAVWAPKGNALVYVKQNNIFYRPEAEVPLDYQITTTGVFGTIYNGVPDWVYEVKIEEVSGDAARLDSYGHYTCETIHYPKSGTTNPTVKLYYVDLDQVILGNGSLVEIEHPPQLNLSERILSAVAFPTDNLVSATWMNRVQNRAYFQLCDVATSSCTTALSHVESNGWVEQFEPPLFSKDGTSFLLVLPQNQGETGDWRHLVLITNATTPSPRTVPLTSGTFVVTEIVTWDQENSYVYYLATTEDDPALQHLYRLSLGDPDSKPECLSCYIKNKSDGSYCLYNSAKFSLDNSYFVLTCAGPGVPEISIYNENNTKLFTWEDNQQVADLIAQKSQPKVKRFAVKVDGGFEAQVRLLLPPNIDISGSTKHPMLVYVYGGPDSYQVTEKFNVDWGTYLVTNKSIIYAVIDGRGSGLKGNRMLFAGYRNLGTVEIVDQINVTRYLQDTFPYIDPSRTAIWGWSYGGYATGMSLAEDRDGVFKCGMSVAPVTDWALYDTIYTERFMGLPTRGDNLGGYEQGRLGKNVDNMRTKSYYLIHGTLDDNVHYQQSLMLAKTLEQNDILFRQQTYTDEDHGIAQSRAHLYHSLENFLNECFETRS